MRNERDERLMAALDECLAAVAAGEAVESCLAAYAADQAEELAGLLEVALMLDEIRPAGPSPRVAAGARAAFMDQVDRMEAAPPRGFAARIGHFLRTSPAQVPRLLPRLATVLVVLAAVLLISGGIVYASNDSLPGDPLYRVKRLAEDVERAVTVGNYDRVELERRIAGLRENEVQELLARSQEEVVIFGGPLVETDEGRWLVDGVVVVVNSATEISGALDPGVIVQVYGVTRADRTVLATRIVSAEEVVYGTVHEITTWRWRVGDTKILLSLETQVEKGIAEGDPVFVRARRFPSGVLMALTIEHAQESGDSEEPPLPTTTPRPTPAPMREPGDDLDGSDVPPATLELEPTEPDDTAATPTLDYDDSGQDDNDAGATPTGSPTEDGNDDDDPATPTAEPAEDGDGADDGSDQGDDGENNDEDDGDDDEGGEDHGGESEATPTPEPTPTSEPSPEPTEEGGD